MTNTDADTALKLTVAKLEAAEAKLIAKYGDKVVAGTANLGAGKYEGKITVEIRTRGLDGEFDGKTLRVATSDVFQVHHQPEVRDALRKLRAAEKRAQRKAEREAEEVAHEAQAGYEADEEALADLID